MPDARVHELHPCSKLLEGGKMMFRSNHSKPPAILSVCKEAREVGLMHYELMDYTAPTDTKAIKRFYFSPKKDTLFLNTLMGLYMAFMLLEVDSSLNFLEGTADPLRSAAPDKGVMKGWQNVALDADRTHLLE